MVTNTTRANDPELVETGEKHDALGRRRTPPERRAELLAAYRSSGLTQMAFARREGITYSTFCTWAQAEREAGRLPRAQAGRRGRRAVPPAAALVRFAEVKVGLSGERPDDGAVCSAGRHQPPDAGEVGAFAGPAAEGVGGAICRGQAGRHRAGTVDL